MFKHDSLLILEYVKNQFIPSAHFWDTVNFRVPWPDWSHPFLNMPTPKIFKHLLICMNLYQHAKNQFIPFVHPPDMVNFQRNIMIQFQENTQTDARMERWTDPISYDPSSYCWGPKKYNCSRLAFKSQRYRVWCWSNQNL